MKKNMHIKIYGTFKTLSCYRKIRLKTTDLGMAIGVLSAIREHHRKISKTAKKGNKNGNIIWTGTAKYSIPEKDLKEMEKMVEEDAVKEMEKRATKDTIKKVKKGYKKIVQSGIVPAKKHTPPITRNRVKGYRKQKGSKYWSKTENTMLVEAVRDGVHWRKVAKQLPNRSDNSVRCRYSQIRRGQWNNLGKSIRLIAKKNNLIS